MYDEVECVEEVDWGGIISYFYPRIQFKRQKHAQMNRLLEGMTGKYRALTLILLTAFIVVGLTAFTQNQTTTIIVSVVICVFLFITRPVWLPESHGKTKVRVLSLTLAFAAIGSFFFWKQLVQEVAVGFIKQFDADIATKLERFEVVPVIALLFLLVVIALVNYWMRDKTAMGIHEKPIKEDIPDLNFNELLLLVVGALYDDLRNIDRETNWSASLFTPLDAEVEVTRGSNREKRVTDLLKAIKRSKERLFLVIGDPGSGKSVALRKLAQDLAKENEVKKTGKIPVYINLKEWAVEKEWTEEKPPTVHELNEFVKENLMGRDIVTSKFFRGYYDRLYETGRLYFILDSFDEIPAVLDEQENSELIKKLSAVIFKFLKGARSKESQGILASRVFRKPTRDFQTNVTLEIRPFTEQKIINTLRRSKVYNDELIKRLFKERSELVPVARNPFMATLISDYAEHNNNRLPANQSEMYESYISRTLDACQSRMDKRGISKSQIIECCIAIADLMFKEYGLEVPIHKVRNRLSHLPIEDAIDVLKFARLGRLGSSDESRFSFVHRRFAEYFAVQKMLQEDYAVDFEAIPSDSRYRDALVLYCEVAEEEKAIAIADFCWSCIQDAENRTRLEVIHALRFLNDAFKGRKELLINFQDDLGNYIIGIINQRKNILEIKLATESLNLLDEKIFKIGLYNALIIQNNWVTETALKSCRSLSHIDYGIEVMILRYVFNQKIIELQKNYSQLQFSFSLSEAFNKVKLALFQRKIADFMLLLSVVSFSFYSITITLAVTALVIFYFFTFKDIEDDTIRYLILQFILIYSMNSILNGNPPNSYLIIPSIFMIPIHFFIKLSFSNKRFWQTPSAFEFQSFKRIIIFFSGALVFFLFTRRIEEYIPLLKYVLAIISVLILLIFALLFFNKIIHLYKSKLEFKMVSQTLGHNLYTRELATAISNMEYEYNELRLLNYIKDNNVKLLDYDTEKDIKIPVQSKEAITLLAQLEEKWLGLDR